MFRLAKKKTNYGNACLGMFSICEINRASVLVSRPRCVQPFIAATRCTRWRDLCACVCARSKR